MPKRDDRNVTVDLNSDAPKLQSTSGSREHLNSRVLSNLMVYTKFTLLVAGNG